ncbi:MAG: hypothetical protein ACI9GW_003497 [Halieaceae bacterium]|jgi:hypothetical protein
MKHFEFGKAALALAFCNWATAPTGAWAESVVVPEPVHSTSGITFDGSDFLIVSDKAAGTLFRYTPSAAELLNGHGPRIASIKIARSRQEAIFGGALASDLEAVDRLANGEVVVLSEVLGAVLTRDRIIARYPKSLAEVGGRGLEGLAIHHSAGIAALWEGGYPSPVDLPTRYPGTGEFNGGPFKPLVCVHLVPTDTDLKVCENGEGVVVLQVPEAPSSDQAFRAPDLVWSADGESFVVLLTSLNASTHAFKYKWLQKFSLLGLPIGPPLNLCEKGYLPGELRSGPGGNVEGLGWYEVGSSVALINDTMLTATAVVLSIDPWPETDRTVRCDLPFSS